jgi:hypothetical protein
MRSRSKDFSYTADSTANYKIVLVAGNSCYTDSFERFVYLSTLRIRDAKAVLLFEVSPNPTDDILNLKISTSTYQPLGWMLYDARGALLLTQKGTESVNYLIDQIDMEEYESGSYWLVIESNSNVLGFRQLIKH